MKLKLPYINPSDFTTALIEKHGFLSHEVWNARHIGFPEEMGFGSLLLFVRNDIHFFRGKWDFKAPTTFLSPDEVGKNGIIDLRISSDGTIDSAALKGHSKFQYDITTIDGMRIFIPEKYLLGDRKKIASKLDYYCLNPNISEMLKQLFRIDYEALGNSILVESKILEFIYLFFEFLKKEDVSAHYADLSDHQLACLRAAKELVDENIGMAISLKELSQRIGINECDLKSGFRKIFGLPVHQYIIKARLEKAHDLVVRTDIPIQSICDLVGYTNRGHFAQLYLKLYGVTPLNDRIRTITTSHK
ncbi:AraC family transcriptional regulator [Algoriphagus sp. 4150]|uniref:AraC family transcriptional regulator n=1 Tax=Algoriphagus sp. 4150 TaxID=2817756 RepID=UPI00286BB898|nr:AraC family transcriptional regulator [Algoriphagus sp. 4150]